jgi:hypothetical protein
LLTREYNDDETGWIDYFMWELNFGRDWFSGRVYDDFGREIKLNSVYDLWSFLENQREVYEKISETYRERRIIAYGRYRGISYYIMQRPAGPCAYLNVTSTPLDGSIQHELNFIDCHGGITWADNGVSGLELDQDIHHWFIGWDYAHFGDWDPYIKEGRIWTTDEIAQECRDVIDKLADSYKNGEMVKEGG